MPTNIVRVPANSKSDSDSVPDNFDYLGPSTEAHSLPGDYETKSPLSQDVAGASNSEAALEGQGNPIPPEMKQGLSHEAIDSAAAAYAHMMS